MTTPTSVRAPETGTASRVVDVGGAPFHLIEGGTGPALLFIHGEEGQRGWLSHHAAFAANHHVIAPTLPGVGESRRPAGVSSVPDVAKRYLWLLDELGIGHAAIVGASLGGWIAAELATMAPERCTSLTVVAPFGVRTEGADVFDIFMTVYGDYMATAFTDHAAPGYRELYLEDGADLDQAIQLMELSALLGFRPYMHDAHLQQFLGRVKAPSLVLWAEDDRVLPRQAVEAFAGCLPAAELAVLPSGGHFPLVQSPEAAIAAITAHLGKGRG